MKNVRFTFYVKKDKMNNEGLVPVYLKIKVNGSSTTFNTNARVDFERWKKTDQFRKTKINDERLLRNNLDELLADFRLVEQKLREKEIAFSAKTVKEVYNNNDPETLTGKIMLSELFDKHYKMFEPLVESEDRAKDTLRKYRTLRNHVNEFLMYEYDLKDIPLLDLNYAFIDSFDSFLRSQKNIGNNTSVKYVQSFRRLMNIAVKYDWLIKDPFLLYEKKIKTKDAVYLTQDELDRIEGLDINIKRLEVVRDIFVFGCYTGYAPVDIQKLTKEHIVKQNDGLEWIMTNRTKTGVQSNVPLLAKAKDIIQKYSLDPFCLETGYLLPRRSNQKMNMYLKEIAEIAEINKKLSAYTSRHTYSVTVILANGLSMEVLSKMLGHTTIKQTQHYGKILDSRVGEEMKTLINKLGNVNN